MFLTQPSALKRVSVRTRAMKLPPIFCINLRRRSDRKRAMKARLQALKANNIRFVEAVDGCLTEQVDGFGIIFVILFKMFLVTVLTRQREHFLARRAASS